MYTFFGYMGITAALVFCNMGAAFGTGKAGVGICQVGMLHTDMIFKSLIPIIMAGILGIYGLIISVLMTGMCDAIDGTIIMTPDMASFDAIIKTHILLEVN